MRRLFFLLVFLASVEGAIDIFRLEVVFAEQRRPPSLTTAHPNSPLLQALENPPESHSVDDADMARILGFEPGSPEFHKLLSEGPPQVPEELTGLRRERLVHFRSAGLPFPPRDSLVPEMPFTAEELEEFVLQHQQDLVRQFAAMIRVQELPRCGQSTTVRNERPIPITGEEDSVFFDVLVLGPEDAELLKGSSISEIDPTTMMILYDPQNPNAGAWSVPNLGVKCLPTRLRVTGKNNFVHIGQDALLSYSAQPNGRGAVVLE